MKQLCGLCNARDSPLGNPNSIVIKITIYANSLTSEKYPYDVIFKANFQFRGVDL